MSIETFPTKILTLGASFISGFIVAAWCLPAGQNKPRTGIAKTGAFIAVPSRDFVAPTSLSELKGKSVRLIRRSLTEKGEDCVIGHKPAQLQIADQHVFLEFGMDGLESIVMSVVPTDLQQPSVIDIEKTTSLKNCSPQPRITYGS
jgi:hypothetical protein